MRFVVGFFLLDSLRQRDAVAGSCCLKNRLQGDFACLCFGVLKAIGPDESGYTGVECFDHIFVSP